MRSYILAFALLGCRSEKSYWDDIDTQTRFDTWVASLEARAESSGVPGFQVAVAIDGEIRHSASWGVRDIRTGAPVTDDTRFALASLGKMFTGATALDLEEDGLIDLDAPVTDVAPGFTLAEGYDASRLTPRMGLGHTSGLPDYLWLGCDYDSYDQVWQAHPSPILTPPGVVHSYTNLGYTMVAHAIEGASGQRFEDAVDTRVFQPLGMTATYDMPDVLAGEYAHGHAGGEPWYEVTEEAWGCVMSKAPAGVWGTTRDVATFLSVTARGEGTLESATFETLAGGHADASCGSGLGTYGAGLVSYHDSPSDYTAVEHAGGIAGFASYAVYLPELDIAVVAANNDWSQGTMSWVYEGLDILLDEPFAATDVPPHADLDLLEGTYVRVDADNQPLPHGEWWAIYDFSTIELQRNGEVLNAVVDGAPVGALQHTYGNCFDMPLPNQDGATVPIEMWSDGNGSFDRLLGLNGSAVREELLSQ